MTSPAPRLQVRTSWLVVALGLLVLRAWESRGLVGGYDIRIYWVAMHALVHGYDPYSVGTFVTPPSGLPFLLPLGLLPFRLAYDLMQLVVIVAVVLSVKLVAQALGATWRLGLLLGLLAAGWTSGGFLTSGFASLNGVILLTWVLQLRASARGDERAVGLWFGLGLALKPVLAPIGLVLLVQRRWKAALWSVVFPLIMGTIGALLVGSEFFDKVLPTLFAGVNQRFNRIDLSLKAVGYRHHWPSGLIGASRALAVVVALVAAVLVWQAARASTSWDLATVRLVEVGSVLFLGTLLASPIGWRYYSVFLLPWLAHLIATRGARLSFLHVVGWPLLLLPDSLGLAFDQAGAPGFNRDRATVAVAVLLVAALTTAVQERRLQTEPAPAA